MELTIKSAPNKIATLSLSVQEWQGERLTADGEMKIMKRQISVQDIPNALKR